MGRSRRPTLNEASATRTFAGNLASNSQQRRANSALSNPTRPPACGLFATKRAEGIDAGREARRPQRRNKRKEDRDREGQEQSAHVPGAHAIEIAPEKGRPPGADARSQQQTHGREPDSGHGKGAPDHGWGGSERDPNRDLGDALRDERA